MDLTFNLTLSYQDLKDSSSRQNFDDTLEQKRVIYLRPRPPHVLFQREYLLFVTIHIYNLHPVQASPRLHVDDSLTKKLLLRIRSEDPEPGWFDEVTFDFFNHDNFIILIILIMNRLLQ